MNSLTISDMSRALTILILIFLISTAALGAGAARQTLLRDGFVLGGVDGKVGGPDGNDVWFFELTSDVSDDKAVVEKGTRLQLLPSATLERITADVEERSGVAYQLWGTITKYRGRNFIFPTFFLPLSKIKEPQSKMPPPQTSQQVTEPNETPPVVEEKSESRINEPNDILAVPQEILKKLEARRTETSSRPSIETIERSMERTANQFSAKADAIIVNRTGFISSSGMRDSYRYGKKQQYGFIFDALGRKIPKKSFRLLPCEALELAEQKQSLELETLKFRIAGIVTKYKDQNYLLLQKATKVYSYGNFAR